MALTSCLTICLHCMMVLVDLNEIILFFYLQVWMYTAILWPGRVISKMWRFSEDACSTYLTSMLSPGSYLGEFNLLIELFSDCKVSESFYFFYVFHRCHSFYSKRYSRALYLGAKAIQLNSNSVQALLLKGVALRNMGRVQEAIIHFREAMRLAPCRLDCYEGKKCFLIIGINKNNNVQLLCVFYRVFRKIVIVLCNKSI